MTKKELALGLKFSYGSSKYYSIDTFPDGDRIICQFGSYLATIDDIDHRFIYAFRYVMDKRVDLKIDMRECILMEEPTGAVIL
jgi:hypothetical protein